MQNRTKYIAQAGVIAAMYVILTLLSAAFGLSSGVIQIRFSEALCILPCFLPAAIPGLAIGCLLSNMLTGSVLLDVLFGSLATLLGAIGTRLLRKHRLLMCFPPILSNMFIIPWILIYAYHLEDAYLFLLLTVGVGESISIFLLGQILYAALKKYK